MDERQEQAAKLLAGGSTQAATAKALGVTRLTVNRWSKLPGFQAAVASLKPAELPKLQTNAQTFPRVSRTRSRVKKPPLDERACGPDDVGFVAAEMPSLYPGTPTTQPGKYGICHWCSWRGVPRRSGAQAGSDAIAHLDEDRAAGGCLHRAEGANMNQYGYRV